MCGYYSREGLIWGNTVYMLLCRFMMNIHISYICTRGLYIFYPISLFLRRFFQKSLPLCMVSIQERFVIKSRLWWHAYGIYTRTATDIAVLDLYKIETVLNREPCIKYLDLDVFMEVPKAPLLLLACLLFSSTTKGLIKIPIYIDQSGPSI